MSDTRTILGIDLGITSVTAAVFQEDGRTRIVPNADGEDSTVAALHVYDAEGVAVGTEALKMAALEPELVVQDVPWHLGEEEWTPEMHGRTWSAQELVGLVLRKVREDASDLRGETITQAVLAVPAWYDSARRHAAVEAAEIGGVEVLSLVNQPLAAALGLGIQHLEEDGPVVLFDLGGRDLEVTVLDKEGDSLTVRGSAVRYDLCFRAFELRIRELLVERYRAEAESEGVPDTEDEMLAQQVVDAAHTALSTLAHRDTATVRISHAGVHVRVTIDRRTFGVRTASLLQAAVALVDHVLGEAGYRPKDTIACIPIGRGSRLPTVQGALRERFRDRLLMPADPDQCIARGAALLAVKRHDKDHPGLTAKVPDQSELIAAEDATFAETADDAAVDGSPPDADDDRFRASFGLADGGHGDDSLFTDATTQDLGLIALDRDRRERVIRVIPQGTPLPCEVKGRFTYAYAGMTGVRVEVTEGRGTRREEVRVVGVVELRGLPPRPVGTPIEIHYAYGEDRILHVHIVDLDTGIRREVDLSFTGGLTDAERREAAARSGAIHLD